MKWIEGRVNPACFSFRWEMFFGGWEIFTWVVATQIFVYFHPDTWGDDPI